MTPTFHLSLTVLLRYRTQIILNVTRTLPGIQTSIWRCFTQLKYTVTSKTHRWLSQHIVVQSGTLQGIDETWNFQYNFQKMKFILAFYLVPSPVLKVSLLFSFPPLINMLKFSRLNFLASGFQTSFIANYNCLHW